MKLFRDLTPEEEPEFRQWAIDNFDPNVEPSEIWHPVVVAEWNRLALLHNNALRLEEK